MIVAKTDMPGKKRTIMKVNKLTKATRRSNESSRHGNARLQLSMIKTSMTSFSVIGTTR